MEKGTGNADAAASLGEPHHLVLERLAAEALGRRDYPIALQYSERRCRISPPPLAHCFVMRAEAAWYLGRRKSALADLDEARTISPGDVAANRRMMLWADDDRRYEAATRIIASDTSVRFLKSAIALLEKKGERAWASTSVSDRDVTGWVAWTGDAAVVASFLDGERAWRMTLVPEPAHPLAGDGLQACSFRITRPLGSEPQHVVLARDGGAFHSLRLPPNDPPPVPVTAPVSAAATAAPAQPTVIVPVYADAAATNACLDSLLLAQQADAFRILVVDDASPEPEIRLRIEALAAAGRIEVLTNPMNIGFVGSVNRAIRHTRTGDIILLNADTLVPPGFAARLCATARQASDIGTVTPLSNNGEFLSFPVPNVVNALDGYDEVVLRDRAAVRANAGTMVDLPSGVGFCLYVTRRCLDAVGALSEQFDRGYLEDVDFCLRARSRGFRSVCAPSVYVGHHGSRSFGKEKRALVVKNLGVLDRHFPTYRAECRSFIEMDPLKSARAALERELPPDSAKKVLIAAGAEALRTIALARARQLQSEGRQAVLLLSTSDSTLRLAASDGGPPQATELRLDSPTAIGSAAHDLARLNPSHLEIFSETAPDRLIELAGRLGLPFDLWITTAGSISLLAVAPHARALLAPTPEALAYANVQMPAANLRLQPIDTAPLVLANAASERAKTIAIVPVTASAKAFLGIRALVDEIASRGHGYRVVVAGATFDDAALMSHAGSFATGPIENQDDLASVLAPHNVVALLTGLDEPIFGHPLIEATRNAPLPVCYIDWSKSMKPRDKDLAISETIDNGTMAKLVVDWLERY